MYRDSLTYEQKVALEAKVALLLSTAVHDGTVVRRMYSALKEVPSKYYGYVVECFRNLTSLSDEVFMKVQVEIQMGTVPVWIWTYKAVMDIKAALKMTNQETVMNLSADRIELKKKIIESSFIMFCRRSALLGFDYTRSLCLAVLDEPELRFLKSACHNILMFIEETKEVKNKMNTEELIDELFELEFDINASLSFKSEMRDNGGSSNEKKSKGSNDTFDVPDVIVSMMKSVLLNQIEEVEEQKGDSKKVTKKQFPYVVTKVLKGSGVQTVLKEFKTKKEAIEFVKQLNEEFPELKNTCSFCIEHEV